MFRSHAMQEVEIVVPEHDIIDVTETLARSAAIHIADSPGPMPEGENSQSGVWQEQVRRLASLEQRLTDLMSALGVEAGTAAGDELHWISIELAERDIESLEREAQEPVRRLEEAHSKLEQLQTLRRDLEPLAALSVEVQRFREAMYTSTMFGWMPAENVERLRTSLEQTPATVLVIGERGRLSAVGLFGLMRDTEVLRRAARSAYLNPISVPSEYRGTPHEVITSLDATIERTRERIAAYQETIHQLQETRIRRMQHLLWRLRASQHLGETIARFRKFQYTYLVTGWVPSDKVAALRHHVEAASEHALVKSSEPTRAAGSQVPFLFDNPPGIRLFEQLVSTYSTPGYRELDPTPLLSVTFPVVFGVMFGDVGHGLILLLLGGFLASGRVERLRSLSQLGGIVSVCGVVSIIFGILYGSLFGFEGVLPAVWLRPLERTEDILVATVLFGVAMLTIGMIYNVIGCLQRGLLGEALFSHNGLAGLVFFSTLVGFGAALLMPQAPVSMDVLLPVSLLSASAIALSGVLAPRIDGRQATAEGGLVMTVMEGFFELFETVISLMSNTLSYVRMGAFAVAHGALSLVVFILAELISPGRGAGYWIVVVLGNAFVIGFEGMIVGIQTLRLEYYELFSKFFTGGGVPFSPLSML
ncbi:MAG: hypothetical protein JXC32_03665 [Anaerolineae bacterium]|nr:hypothetical protein [Anaerolineae bacterium]